MGAGLSSNDAYLMFSGTSPSRVGAYLRMFPTLDGKADSHCDPDLPRALVDRAP